MAEFLTKKVRVPVHLDGDDEVPPCDFYLFYSFACGEYLLEKYGSPQKADRAFFGAFFKEVDGMWVPKTDMEAVDGELFRILANYVYGMTITWAKQNGKEPVDIMDQSIDDIGTLLNSVVKAFGIAMPKPDENAKKGPQTP